MVVGLWLKFIPYLVRTVEESKLHLKSRRGRPLMKVFREHRSGCSGVHLGVLVEKQGGEESNTLSTVTLCCVHNTAIKKLN